MFNYHSKMFHFDMKRNSRVPLIGPLVIETCVHYKGQFCSGPNTAHFNLFESGN